MKKTVIGITLAAAVAALALAPGCGGDEFDCTDCNAALASYATCVEQCNTGFDECVDAPACVKDAACEDECLADSDACQQACVESHRHYIACHEARCYAE